MVAECHHCIILKDEVAQLTQTRDKLKTNISTLKERCMNTSKLVQLYTNLKKGLLW